MTVTSWAALILVSSVTVILIMIALKMPRFLAKIRAMKNLFKNKKISLVVVLFAALILHLFIAFQFEATGDSGGWRLAGITGLHGGQLGMGNGTVYDGDCPLLCSNWPPLTYHYYIAMRWLYENVNPLQWPHWGYNKLLPVLSTVGIAYLLYKYALLFKARQPLFLSALYAFHPLSLYVSAYHGQRESVWLFFLLLSLYVWLKYKQYFLFAILFAISVSVKIPPLLLAPFLLLSLPTIKSKLGFILIVPFVFFTLNLPEIVTYKENVFKQVFFYGGEVGWWGFSAVAVKIDVLTGTSISNIVASSSKALQYIAVILGSIYFYRKKFNAFEGLLGILMIVFVFSSIFAPQYMLWPLPFMVLLYNKYKKLLLIYSISAAYAAMNVYGIFGIRFIEYLLVNLPQTYIYYKIPHLTYPLDLYFPLWIVSVLFLISIIQNGGAYVKRRKK